jgi:glycosyltransferase involved in cell wall biosynthesis
MVSIVIPCYNYARFLRPALDSALAQARPDLPVEVLVVNDGSTDDSSIVIAAYGDRVRCIDKNNAGLSAARNTGMREARYDLVQFLDADDVLAPNAIHHMLSVRSTLADPPVIMAGTSMAINSEGDSIEPWPPESSSFRYISARQLVLKNRFMCAVMADRRVLLDLGGFDVTLQASEDRDMWIRAAALGPAVQVDRCVVLKRTHGANMSLAARRQTDCIQKVLAKSFANPRIVLSHRDRRLAQAVCFYQSALMYSVARDYRMALSQLLKSMRTHPLGSLQEADVRPWRRMISLAAISRSALRSLWRSK